MNIIIDTNLWISFLIGKKLSILKALLAHPDLKIYVCDELVEEFKDVSSRDKIRKYISEQDIIDSLKIIDLYCCYCSVERMAISPVRDAKDFSYIFRVEINIEITRFGFIDSVHGRK